MLVKNGRAALSLTVENGVDNYIPFLRYLEGKPDVNRDSPTGLERLSTYQKLLAATDYVSGMADSYTVDRFQKLSGIQLPE